METRTDSTLFRNSDTTRIAIVSRTHSEPSEQALQYVRALAWPVLVLILALIFRTEIVSFLKRITKAEAFGVKMEVSEEVKELREELEEVGASPIE